MSISLNYSPAIPKQELDIRSFTNDQQTTVICEKPCIVKKELSLFTLKKLENIICETLLTSTSIQSKQENLISTLKGINLNQYTWQNYIFFSNNYLYTRNLVLENELFELIIICWEKNVNSPIHDHPSDGCWFVGIQGQISEEKYIKNEDSSFKLVSRSELHEGDIAYMHDFMGYHSVGNPSYEDKAITLHIYSPPVRRCNIVMENRCMVEKELKYFSKYGKIVNN
jgi:cysteine dioxygenase